MAGLTGPDQELPAAVRVKHGTNRNGKTIHYYMNYSSDPQTFKYPYKPGEDLLTEASVAPFQAVTLKPWDLAILEEK
jgi:beta-galactosidase